MKQIFVLTMSLVVWASAIHAEMIKDFSFTSIDGQVYQFSKLKGTPLVITFTSHR